MEDTSDELRERMEEEDQDRALRAEAQLERRWSQHLSGYQSRTMNDIHEQVTRDVAFAIASGNHIATAVRATLGGGRDMDWTQGDEAEADRQREYELDAKCPI